MKMENIKIGHKYFLKENLIKGYEKGAVVTVLKIKDGHWPIDVELSPGECCPVDYYELTELTDELKVNLL